LSQFKKYHPSGNLKFFNLGFLKSLKLRILVRKILPISLKLNFTPNALGCKGLKVCLKDLFRKIYKMGIFQTKSLETLNDLGIKWELLGNSIWE